MRRNSAFSCSYSLRNKSRCRNRLGISLLIVLFSIPLFFPHPAKPNSDSAASCHHPFLPKRRQLIRPTGTKVHICRVKHKKIRGFPSLFSRSAVSSRSRPVPDAFRKGLTRITCRSRYHPSDYRIASPSSTCVQPSREISRKIVHLSSPPYTLRPREQFPLYIFLNPYFIPRCKKYRITGGVILISLSRKEKAAQLLQTKNSIFSWPLPPPFTTFAQTFTS